MLHLRSLIVEYSVPTVGLSHPRALTPISDPVHTRIELTLFDRNLIDCSLFQRLHYILQNSVNYVSFPSNKNTRFPHSIGTAHTSGWLFSRALSNAQTVTLKDFLGSASKFIEHTYKTASGSTKGLDHAQASHEELHAQCERAHKFTISGRSGFLHAPLFKEAADDRV
jgi:hypothetical protein